MFLINNFQLSILNYFFAFLCVTNMTDEIKNTLAAIPNKPGCYQFLDEKGTVIYVGKAKDLKKRVSSYFAKIHEHPKTRILVRNIRQIKYVVVDTEEDTFLLENNLIKEFQPRYNVLLKDDKTYPSIVIKNEFYPRVFQTRNVVKDGSKYFGPYTSVVSVRMLLEIFRQVYNVRTCRLNLTPENIAAGKFNVCLEYHIKRCKGPCVGLQSMEEYDKNVREIHEILKGNVGILGNQLHDEMQRYAEELRFEEAQEIKEKYLRLENFRQKSLIISNLNYNIDVFAYEDDENSA